MLELMKKSPPLSRNYKRQRPRATGHYEVLILSASGSENQEKLAASFTDSLPEETYWQGAVWYLKKDWVVGEE